MRHTRTLAVAAVLVLLVVGCAHQPALPVHVGTLPGFFRGLWHGLVAPIAFVGSLFSDVKMYAWPNGGGWYDLGFLIGIGAWGGGAAAAR